MSSNHITWTQRAKAVARTILEQYEYNSDNSIADVRGEVIREIAGEMVSEFGSIDALTGALDGEEVSLNRALIECVQCTRDAYIGHQLRRRLMAWARPWAEAALHDIPGNTRSIHAETAARDYQQRLDDFHAETRG